MKYTIRSDSTNELSLCENDELKSIAQNILLIMNTRRGTVPMYRDFGLPMSFIDKPTELAKAIMASEIKEALEKFEPRAKFSELRLIPPENDVDKLTAVLEVEIQTDDEQTIRV